MMVTRDTIRKLFTVRVQKDANLPAVLQLAKGVATALSAERSGSPWVNRLGIATDLLAIVYGVKMGIAPSGDVIRVWMTDRGALRDPPPLESGDAVFLTEAGRSLLVKKWVIPDWNNQTDAMSCEAWEYSDGNLRWYIAYSKRDRTWVGPYLTTGTMEEVHNAVYRAAWAQNDGCMMDIYRRRITDGTLGYNYAYRQLAVDDFVCNFGAASRLEMLSARYARFKAAGVSRKILVHGPPGTGKSTFARIVASRIGGGKVIRIAASDLRGASFLLTVLRPDVVVIDDLDREDSSHILDSLHAIEDVTRATSGTRIQTIIATLNTLSAIDPAMLRPGRFDEHVCLKGLADEDRKTAIIQYSQRYGVNVTEQLATEIAEHTSGFSPAEIDEVMQTVAVLGLPAWNEEVRRVGSQRETYAGDACERYLTAKGSRVTAKSGESLDGDSNVLMVAEVGVTVPISQSAKPLRE